MTRSRAERSAPTAGHERQAVDLMTALRDHAPWAAASIHRDATVGSLEPGQARRHGGPISGPDPTLVAFGELLDIEVRPSWVGSRLAFAAG